MMAFVCTSPEESTNETKGSGRTVHTALHSIMKTITKLASIAGLALGLSVAAQAQLSLVGAFTGAFNGDTPSSDYSEFALPGSSSTIGADPLPNSPFTTITINDAGQFVAANLYFNYNVNGEQAPVPVSNYNLTFNVSKVIVGATEYVLTPGELSFSTQISFVYDPVNSPTSLLYSLNPVTVVAPFMDGQITFDFYTDTQANPIIDLNGTADTFTSSSIYGRVSYSSAVPEPSTYGMIGAGALLALVGYRRFKAKKA